MNWLSESSAAAAVRWTARVLTGSTFVLLGLDAARVPGDRVDQAAPMIAALRRVLPLPRDDQVIVRGNGVAQTVGGAALVVGVAPDAAALTLVASLIPTTLAGHSYWEHDDPIARKVQRIQFHKNMAMIGGLLFALTDRHRDVERTPVSLFPR